MRLRVIDFETTGFEPPAAEVIEAAMTDAVIVDGNLQILGTADALFGATGKIPAAVRAVHHIGPNDIEGLAPFSQADLADEPFSGGGAVDAYVAHNKAFEEKFFSTDLPFICTYKTALHIWPDLESHANFALFYWFEEQGWLTDVPPERIGPAHRAGPDTFVTACNLMVMLQHASIEQMIEWSKMPRPMHKWAFGKHKGLSMAETPYDYLNWAAFKSDLDEDVKWNCRQEIERRSAGGGRR